HARPVSGLNACARPRDNPNAQTRRPRCAGDRRWRCCPRTVTMPGGLMHTSAESSPISPPADARLARTGRELAYVLATLPLATVWFCVLGTGWMVALTALPFVVGLPVLIALFVICDWCGAAERAVARKLLHARI